MLANILILLNWLVLSIISLLTKLHNKTYEVMMHALLMTRYYHTGITHLPSSFYFSPGAGAQYRPQYTPVPTPNGNAEYQPPPGALSAAAMVAAAATATATATATASMMVHQDSQQPYPRQPAPTQHPTQVSL